MKPATAPFTALPHGLGGELRIGSVCSGYGGLDLAIHAVIGGDLAWVADNGKGASKILAHRFPDVPNLGDLAAVDWSGVEPVDILGGGVPCQDVSCAGARAGLKAGSRTGVWAYMADGIAALRPSLVVIENVRGLLSAKADSNLEWCPWCLGNSEPEFALRALGAILGDLADLGLDAQWVTVSASDVGAPHRRERVFVLAWPAADTGRVEIQRRGVAGVLAGPERAAARARDQRERDGDTAADRCATAANPAGHEPGRDGPEPGDNDGEAGNGPRTSGGGAAQDADGAARDQRGQPAPGQAQGRGPRADAGGSGGACAAADTADRRWHGGHPGLDAGTAGRRIKEQVDPGGSDGAAADSGRDPRPEDDADGDVAARCSGIPAAHAESDRRHQGRTEPAGIVRGPDAAFGSAVPRCESAPADPIGVGWDGRPSDPRRGPERGAAAAGSGEVDIDWGIYEPAIRRWERVLGRPAPRPTEPGRTGERLSPRFVEFMMGLPDGWVTGVPGLSRNQQLEALGNGVVPQQGAYALELLLPAWRMSGSLAEGAA